MRSFMFVPGWPSCIKSRFGVRRRALLLFGSVFLLSFVVILFLLPDARTRVLLHRNTSLLVLRPEDSFAANDEEQVIELQKVKTDGDEGGGNGHGVSILQARIDFCTQVHDDAELEANRDAVEFRLNRYNCSEYRKEVVKKIKLSVFKLIVVLVLSYGHESWTMTEKLRSRVEAAEIGFLRLVPGPEYRHAGEPLCTASASPD
ncbi:unnamed protein product [Soboliphyme baturini]|uniref:P4Hc domain-containing protein n=1 Tax=Soboliphyme baturini TaxID=241478 RepID=A0A183IT39_9BILA|nr:unnamed protein product [Soboliphyme baturini]